MSTSSLSNDFQYVIFVDELHNTQYAQYDRTDADTLADGSISGDVGTPGPALTSTRVISGNRTNLAIKGIIAIAAMSKMSLAIGRAADAEKYYVCINKSDLQAVQ